MLLLSLLLLFSAALVAIAVGVVVVVWAAPANSPVVVAGRVRAAMYCYRIPRSGGAVARGLLSVKVLEMACQ